MGYIVSNLGPILAATLAGLIVGSVFLRLVRSDPSGRLGLGAVVVAVAAEFWLASILAGALILAPTTPAGPWVMAIASAVVIWIGFVVPTQVVSGLARSHGPAAITLDCVHWLAVMVVEAAVLQAIGLTHP